MRTLIPILLTACILCSCSAEQKSFVHFYKAHKHDKEVFNLNIPPLLAKIIIPKDEKQIKEFMKQTSKMRILVKSQTSIALANELNGYLRKDTYHDLLYIRDGSDLVRITAKFNEKNIREVIITVNDDDSFVAVQLIGTYTIESIQKLAKSMS